MRKNVLEKYTSKFKTLMIESYNETGSSSLFFQLACLTVIQILTLTIIGILLINIDEFRISLIEDFPWSSLMALAIFASPIIVIKIGSIAKSTGNKAGNNVYSGICVIVTAAFVYCCYSFITNPIENIHILNIWPFALYVTVFIVFLVVAFLSARLRIFNQSGFEYNE